LRLPYLAIVLPGDVTAAAYGARPSGEPERLPLHHGGSLVGELVVARRHPAEPLTPLDRRLLDDLSGHLAVAVRAAALDEELRHSHRRLLAIREEERDRIRRDLHDELGSLLGAAALRAQAASNLLGDGDDRLRGVVGAIGSDLGQALDAIRRILADLQPEPLDRHGLLAALRERVRTWDGRLAVTLDLPRELPPLSAPVETAAYRIAVEALHNAARHSGGTRATLCLRVTGDAIEVEVTDDGAGLPAEPRSGVGIRSMRERAERLGGSLSVGSIAGGGARVHGVLPALSG
jgi:two-component system NarL family sensor kinase